MSSSRKIVGDQVEADRLPFARVASGRTGEACRTRRAQISLASGFQRTEQPAEQQPKHQPNPTAITIEQAESRSQFSIIESRGPLAPLPTAWLHGTPVPTARGGCIA